MRPLDWLIVTAAVVAWIVACAIWQHVINPRAQLAVAEDIINTPCLCGCDTCPEDVAARILDRITSETPLYDGLLVRDLYDDLEAFERGETA